MKKITKIFDGAFWLFALLAYMTFTEMKKAWRKVYRWKNGL